MTEEKKDQAVELFLHADRKIEKVIADVSALVKEDLGLSHKMDLVIQAQTQLKEGFDHSRTTGHKTWEAVQKMATLMERMESRVTIAEDAAKTAKEVSHVANTKFDRLIFATIIAACVSIVVIVVVALVKFSARL